MKQSCEVCGFKFKIHPGEIRRDLCEACTDNSELLKITITNDAIELLAAKLNEANSAKFRAMSREDQEVIVAQAFRDEIITWKISRTS